MMMTVIIMMIDRLPAKEACHMLHVIATVEMDSTPRKPKVGIPNQKQ
jgi:hypothetical protein